MASKGSPTQEFIDIADIRDTVVILHNGSLRSIVEVASINFDLKSADEQTGVLRGFQSFLNSLDFPLQVVIGSRTLNLASYIASLKPIREALTNDLLKMQMDEYTKFIKGLAELANIMSKKFYVVIPYYATEATFKQKGGFMKKITSVFAPSTFANSIDDETLAKYKQQLDQRIGLIEGSLGGLGLSVKTLGHDELLALFNDFYNPVKTPTISEQQ